MMNILRLIAYGIVAMGAMAASGTSHAASPVDPSGTWLTEDGRARIRIERCGPTLDEVCGYIVWMKSPLDPRGQPFRDEFNPDKVRRSRPVLGHQLLMGLKPNAEGRFEGQIYNAEDGKSYAVSLWRVSPDRLKLKGCMLAILCSTQNWVSTNDALPGQLVGVTGELNGPKPDKEWARPAPPPKSPVSVKTAR